MSQLFVGLDTSCYTSSVACIDSDGIVCDERILLHVNKGERGLRQSDAVFQHTRNLDALISRVFYEIDPRLIRAVGVSSCPSGRENSYMPVFLSGKTAATAISSSLRVPINLFTHQQGHIRAALYGNELLMGQAFFAIHLSGGTTDILKVDPSFDIIRVGGSNDINAGQLVDRIGVKLGLPFPAGKSLERLAEGKSCTSECQLPSSVKGLDCSFSGVETKALGYVDAGIPAEIIAVSIYDCIARTLAKLIRNAAESFGINKFLLAGGVASSAILKDMLRERLKSRSIELYFADSKLASDNAVGIALLTRDRFN